MRPGVDPLSKLYLYEMSDVSFSYLRDYAKLLNLELRHPLGFKSTPEGKNYSAKATISAYFNGKPAGDIVLVAMRPGDGTGDKTPTTPRNKDGTFAELLFPLGTFSFDYRNFKEYHNKFNSLWEMGLNEAGKTIHIRTHGLSVGDFCKVYHRIMPTPSTKQIISETLECPIYDAKPGDNRFGNDHAIYASKILPLGVQVAAFLPITEDNLMTFGKSISNFTSMANYFKRPNHIGEKDRS